MKKTSIITMMTLAMVLMIGFGAKAQRGDILAGGGLGYATKIDKPAIFIGGVYQITPEWEGAADFTYFFSDKVEAAYSKWTLRWSALNLNAHYVFYNENQIEAYGLGGLSIRFATAKYEYTGPTGGQYDYLEDRDYSSTDSDVGLNLGAGGRYQLSDNLYGVAEMKFTILDGSYFQIGAGIQYKF